MRRLLALSIAAISLALAGSALASVLVYKNGFGSKSDFKQIGKLAGGNACKKSYKGGKVFEGHVKKGGKECLFTTPVEGDRDQPNFTVQAEGKVLKKTDKRIRSKVYVGVAARANKKSAYEVRVFPKGRTYALLKNGAELSSGKNKAIKALDEKNKVRLSVDRGSITARVNGKSLASFDDQSVEEVRGRKAALAFGSEGRSKNKEGFVRIDRVKVFVPNP
jgi:hypothetical protein